MRALCLTAAGGPQQLAILDLPPPRPPGPAEVRIGVRTVALNHLDLWVSEGLKAVPIPAFPHVVGADAAGVVLETGADVTHVRRGDRVVVNPGISCGTCAACTAGVEVFCRKFSLLGEHLSGVATEEIVVPGRNVLPINDSWTWPEAGAFTLVSLTAWRMLTTRAQLQRNELVLIWGIGGGVAIAALQIAQHLGARVIVTSSSDSKLANALSLGAEAGINHATSEDVVALVKAHFERGADVVVDTVGAATWERSLKSLRPGGRLVSTGATTGHHVELDLRRLFWFQWSLLGSTMGTSREFAEIVTLGNQGRIRPPIDTVLPLADGREGYRRLAEGKQFGKIVLEVST